MAVSFNANAGNQNGGTTSLGDSGALNIGAGANTVLVVLASFSANVSALAITWNSVAMTQLGSSATATTCGFVYCFYMLAPATGAKGLSGTWTTTSDYTFSATAFNGAVGGVGNLNHANGNSGTSAVTVTTLGALDGVFASNQNTDTSDFSATTHSGTQVDNFNATSINSAYNYLLAPSTSQSMSNAVNGTDVWLAMGVNIFGESVGASKTYSLSTLGVGLSLRAAKKIADNDIIRRRDFITPWRFAA